MKSCSFQINCKTAPRTSTSPCVYSLKIKVVLHLIHGLWNISTQHILNAQNHPHCSFWNLDRAYPSHRNRLCRQLFWFSSLRCSLRPPHQKHNRNLEILRLQLQPHARTAFSSLLPDKFVTVTIKKKHLNRFLTCITPGSFRSWPTQLLQPLTAPRSAFGLSWEARWVQHSWHARTTLLSTRLLVVISFRHGRGRGIDCLGSSDNFFPRYLLRTFYSKTGTNVCTKPTDNN